VLFSAVSTYANLLHGLAFAQPVALSLGEWEGMPIASHVLAFTPALRPLLLSGVLPLLVIYLTEVVSEKREMVIVAEERGRRRVQRVQQPVQQADALAHLREQARVQREQRKKEVMDRLVQILSEAPDTPVTTIAERLNISRTTVYNYLKELEETGRIRRNGSVHVTV